MTDFDWQAQWIWAEETDETRHFYFRRDFDLPSAPVSATLRITADDRYRVHVNYRPIGTGPVRSKPSHQSYDEYSGNTKNVSPKNWGLQAGRNVISVLAAHYGIGTAFSCNGRPGLLAQLDMTFEDGSTRTIATDAEWKTFPAPYEVGYERMCIMLAYPEVIDLRREPIGWRNGDFDASDWRDAVVLGPVGIGPWTHLIPRDIPLISHLAAREPIGPLLATPAYEIKKAVGEQGKRKTPAEDMERATSFKLAASGSIKSIAGAGHFLVAPQSGETGVSITLDFGREVSGYAYFFISKCGGGRIDIGYSERLEPDGTVNPNRWGGPPVHYADRVYLRASADRRQSFETLEPRAFRYMRFDFYDNPEPLEISVAVIKSGYPIAWKGDFQCSDALLGRIWEVGRYTTELCMDDAFMDCPWRERGQYLGDLAVEMRIAAYAFGDTKLARRGLAQFPLGANERGWFPGVYPAEPPWDPVLPTFCFLWLVALWDYFLLSGDKTLLETVWPAVDKLTRTMGERDADGLLMGLPTRGFVDHAPAQDDGQATSVNAFAVWGLQAAGRIARTIGIPGRGSELEILASDSGDALNDMMWDNGRGLYLDGYPDGQPNLAVSEHANILCALVGVADQKQTAQILRGVLADSDQSDITEDKRPSFPSPNLGEDVGTNSLSPPPNLGEGPGVGAILPETIRMASPYFAYYYLRLLFKNNRHMQALAFIRRRWGAMIEAGATTFWEMWEPNFSLCHAWSAGPTFDLMAEIAGIRPTQPGFEEFTVHPQPCHLTWIRCTVPTPKGDILFGYHRQFKINPENPNGPQIPLGLVVNLTVPPETLADVRIPLPESARSSAVRINNAPVWEAGRPLPGNSKYRRDADVLQFAAGPGTYHIEIDADA